MKSASYRIFKQKNKKFAFRKFFSSLTTIESAKLIIKNPAKTAMILLFDVLLVITLISLNKILTMALQLIQIQATSITLIIFLISNLFYRLIQVLIFSFFALMTLEFIKFLLYHKEFKIKILKILRKFYLLNLILGLAIGIFIIIVSLLIYNAKPDLRIPLVFITAIPLVISSYLVVSLSHPLFYESGKIKKTLKEAFKFLTRKRPYSIVLQSAIIILGLYSLYSLVYSVSSGMPKMLFLNAFIFLLYAVFFINRISFFRIVLEK